MNAGGTKAERADAQKTAVIKKETALGRTEEVVLSKRNLRPG